MMILALLILAPSSHLETGPQSPPSPPSLDPTAGSQPRTTGPSCALHTSRSLAPTMMILALPSLTPMTETLTLTPTLGGFQPILRQDTERDPQACRNEKICISPTQWVESRNMEQMPQKPYTSTDLPQTCPDSPQPEPSPHPAPGPRTPSCFGVPRSSPRSHSPRPSATPPPSNPGAQDLKTGNFMALERKRAAAQMDDQEQDYFD
jgi:hypothetical protein